MTRLEKKEGAKPGRRRKHTDNEPPTAITFRIHPLMLAALKNLAIARGVQTSFVVREALADLLCAYKAMPEALKGTIDYLSPPKLPQ